ncbi:FtsB family cell division protein [Ligilactobacillus equi]|uniref:Cell division protein DIVIC n=1 Tax=Ligilactobacillus equi DPC 6820 TaxID=1392007 RepID=V7HY61_9LACO|nr:septum formation initiator family protein [Ligilactobacillus equi]ETA73951.1 cell division protein DIVIC [Ligilactobacillus equi DPC 6820]
MKNMGNKAQIKVIENQHYIDKANKRNLEKYHLQRQMKLERDRIVNRWFWMLSLAFLGLVIIFCSFQVVNYKHRLYQVQQQEAVARKELSKEESKQAKLKQQVTQLKDMNYVEKIIRDKYNYTKKGETNYNLPN